ncbi:MAG: DNA-protecting protein DprA [Spirochaetes bacterium]|nr:DNA-protecting protein DprA [Spirochaetota bacterium]
MNKYRYWIALEQAEGIGFSSMQKIYDTLSPLNLSISDLFDLTEKEIISEFNFNSHIVKGIISAAGILEETEEDYLNIVEAGIKPLMFFEENYPHHIIDLLKSSAPPILFCFGNTSLLKKPSGAILGHSEISSKGENIAYQSSKILASHDITVISGLSKGSGTIVHKSAIENSGTTIGVLPCGMFTFSMSEKIKEIFNPDNFLIISPFRTNEPYNEFNAMARNRLICALSKAVFIVEAPEVSGIFEAVKSASKLHIPVFTAEYSEFPESASGNMKMIKEFNACPVRGKKENNIIIPNIDAFISKIKFGINT